jgi:hypothetical protein
MDAEQTTQTHAHTTDTDELAHVGGKLPNALGPKEMIQVLNLGQRNFYVLQARGAFDRFLLKNPIGRKRYSGRLVERYLQGGTK